MLEISYGLGSSITSLIFGIILFLPFAGLLVLLVLRWKSNIMHIGLIFLSLLFVVGGGLLALDGVTNEKIYEKVVVDSKSDSIIITRKYLLTDENIQISFGEIQVVVFRCNTYAGGASAYGGDVEIVKLDGSEFVISRDHVDKSFTDQWKLATLLSNTSGKKLQIIGKEGCIEKIPR